MCSKLELSESLSSRDAKFTVAFFFVRLRISQPGREILYDGSATSRTGLLPFWGIAPGMAEPWPSI